MKRPEQPRDEPLLLDALDRRQEEVLLRLDELNNAVLALLEEYSDRCDPAKAA